MWRKANRVPQLKRNSPLLLLLVVFDSFGMSLNVSKTLSELLWVHVDSYYDNYDIFYAFLVKHRNYLPSVENVYLRYNISLFR